MILKLIDIICAKLQDNTYTNNINKQLILQSDHVALFIQIFMIHCIISKHIGNNNIDDTGSMAKFRDFVCIAGYITSV